MVPQIVESLTGSVVENSENSAEIVENASIVKPPARKLVQAEESGAENDNDEKENEESEFLEPINLENFESPVKNTMTEDGKEKGHHPAVTPFFGSKSTTAAQSLIKPHELPSAQLSPCNTNSPNSPIRVQIPNRNNFNSASDSVTCEMAFVEESRAQHKAKSELESNIDNSALDSGQRSPIFGEAASSVGGEGSSIGGGGDNFDEREHSAAEEDELFCC